VVTWTLAWSGFGLSRGRVGHTTSIRRSATGPRCQGGSVFLPVG
jgi:hypothetical protein